MMALKILWRTSKVLPPAAKGTPMSKPKKSEMPVAAATTCSPSLARISATTLEIVGLRCGIKRNFWSENTWECRGKLLVEDWHPKGVRGDSRYEIYCDECKSCDPNGWARQAEIIPGALSYFAAIPSPEND